MLAGSCQIRWGKMPPRRIQVRFALGLALVFTALLQTGCGHLGKPAATGPWSLRELSAAPPVQWGAAPTGRVQALFYEGVPLDGKPTRVFAYLGRPQPGSGSPKRFPAMVLVHGGGGKAFAEWADHWAKRGYVALAMDLGGQGPSGRLPDGGPEQSDLVKFRNFESADVPNMWTYHAIAAVLRGHSLLRSLPDVDPNRTGITGISWGGYLTCIAAGVDSRFKVAVPVYGCGYLGDNSVWKDTSLKAMTPEARERWLHWFDPSRYVGGARMPMLFVNGTTDFAYPLDSYLRTYRLVPEQWRQVSVAINRPHGHIWTFPEVDAFVDTALMGKPPFPRLLHTSLVGENESQLRAVLRRTGPLREVQLCYTTDTGPWQQRTWRTAPAQLDGDWLRAELPKERPLVAFLAVKDAAGNHVSSEHVSLAGPLK